MNPPTLHTVPGEVRHARADKALATAFPDHSRVAFQRAFDAGRVTLGGRPIRRSATVHAGDVLTFSFPEVKPNELRAVDIRLDVLFEDKWLLAINKPAGMVVHPGAVSYTHLDVYKRQPPFGARGARPRDRRAGPTRT